MLQREHIAFLLERRTGLFIIRTGRNTKHTVCRKALDVKLGGVYSNCCVLKD
jgi:hypothetical protein